MRVALRWSGGAICPPDDLEIVADRGQEDIVMYVIEVSELKFEDRYDLRGCLEATMARRP